MRGSTIIGRIWRLSWRRSRRIRRQIKKRINIHMSFAYKRISTSKRISQSKYIYINTKTLVRTSLCASTPYTTNTSIAKSSRRRIPKNRTML